MSRFVLPRESTFDINGLPQSGATLDFYEVGTTTRKDTFSDEALTTPNANPVVADANGTFPNIWLSGDYDAVLKNSDGVTVWGPEKVEQFVTESSGKYNPSTVNEMINDVRFSQADIGGDPATTKEFSTGNGGGGVYDVVLTTSVTPNGYNIIQGAADTSISFALRVGSLSVDAKQFGATGDGSTNDTAALQAALDYAQTNQKALYIPGGEYMFDQLEWPRGVRIFGDGCMGTLEVNDKFSQTMLIQNTGIEKSGFVLKPGGSEGADLQMEDLILLGPATATTGTYHGIEFVTEAGVDVSVAGQVHFTNLFIRRWKGSGIKTSDTKRVFAFFGRNIQSRDNGRYGFEFGYHADVVKLSGILTEKNRLAGVYINEMPANFHCSIDGWYMEGGFDNNDAVDFGDHPSFAYVSPYALELGGVSTNTSNTVIRVSNLTCKASQSASRTLDAAIWVNPQGGRFSNNVEWNNIVMETQGITSGNGDILLDQATSTRIAPDMSSGYFFQDASYAATDYSGRNHFITNSDFGLKIERNGSDGAFLVGTDDGTNVTGVGVTGSNEAFLSSIPNNDGIKVGNARVNPCTASGANQDATIDLGDGGDRWRNIFLSGYVSIGDGISAPGSSTGQARLYVDSADGDLKIVFGDGTVKTIVVDT